MPCKKPAKYQYPSEKAKEITKVYNRILQRKVSEKKLEAIHEFLKKNPDCNLLRCLTGKDIDHCASLVQLFSDCQKKHDDFRRCRNLPRLYLSSVRNWPKFLLKLKNATELSFAGFLKAKFSYEIREVLEQYNGGNPSKKLKKMLIKELNRLLQNASLYDEEYFPNPGLNIRILLGQNLERDKLLRLNRLLLEEEFTEIAKMQTKINISNFSELDETLYHPISSESPLDAVIKTEERETLEKIVKLTLNRLTKQLRNIEKSLQGVQT